MFKAKYTSIESKETHQGRPAFSIRPEHLGSALLVWAVYYKGNFKYLGYRVFRDAFGPFVTADLGKIVVYSGDGVVQMENDEQRAARLGEYNGN